MLISFLFLFWVLTKCLHLNIRYCAIQHESTTASRCRDSYHYHKFTTIGEPLNLNVIWIHYYFFVLSDNIVVFKITETSLQVWSDKIFAVIRSVPDPQ
jgi:hypothetical protein